VKNGELMGFYSDLMGFNGIYPLVMTNIAMENGGLMGFNGIYIPSGYVKIAIEHGH